MPRIGCDVFVLVRGVIVAGALGLVAATIIGVTHVAPLERVYTVAEVTWGLRHHPQAWRGRTVLVRGGWAMGAQHILPLRCPCPQETYVNVIAPPDPAAVRVISRTTRGNVTRVIVSYPDNYLHVRVPSGAWVRPATPLPSALYTLPLIGAMLGQPSPATVPWCCAFIYRPLISAPAPAR